jgi:hypothetical protein
MSRYVKDMQALNRSVVYITQDGEYFRHIGGTVAWRNNNRNYVPKHAVNLKIKLALSISLLFFQTINLVIMR